MTKLYAVVPAAGVGARMQADRPKQYLSILGKTILEHTLERLLRFEDVQHMVLPVSAHDTFFSSLGVASHEKVTTCNGGAERFESVLNGLNALLDLGAQLEDRVLVHDVARPCISLKDLTTLTRSDCSQGVILGAPVRDTMKRTLDSGKIDHTVSRENLWHALTPQMAPLGKLKAAIEQALVDGAVVTDEASALEHMGYQPMMLEGSPSNIKVTRPEDLFLATAYLSYENQQCSE